MVERLEYDEQSVTQSGGHLEWGDAESLGEADFDDIEWWGVVEGDLFAQQFYGNHLLDFFLFFLY